MKMTPWFPAHIRPVHLGLYLVDTDKFNAPNYRYWTGIGWSCTYGSVANAKQFATNELPTIYGADETPWRGLAVKP